MCEHNSHSYKGCGCDSGCGCGMHHHRGHHGHSIGMGMGMSMEPPVPLMDVDEEIKMLEEYKDALNTHLEKVNKLSLIHISEPTRRTPISYAVFCLKKKT